VRDPRIAAAPGRTLSGQGQRMRRLTIAERQLVVALLPLLVFMVARSFGAALPWPETGALAGLGPLAFDLGMIAFAVG